DSSTWYTDGINTDKRYPPMAANTLAPIRYSIVETPDSSRKNFLTQKPPPSKSVVYESAEHGHGIDEVRIKRGCNRAGKRNHQKRRVFHRLFVDFRQPLEVVDFRKLLFQLLQYFKRTGPALLHLRQHRRQHLVLRNRAFLQHRDGRKRPVTVVPLEQLRLYLLGHIRGNMQAQLKPPLQRISGIDKARDRVQIHRQVLYCLLVVLLAFADDEDLEQKSNQVRHAKGIQRRPNVPDKNKNAGQNKAEQINSILALLHLFCRKWQIQLPQGFFQL